MSDKPVKINVPKDPIVIGKTKDGQPIWMEPKDLIPTPDEDLERWDKTLDSRQNAMIHQAANLVIENGITFIEETCVNAEPKCASVPDRDFGTFLLQIGFTLIQDGLTTIVKRKGRVLREMTANIEPRWREHVAKRVNQLVARTALRSQRN